MTCSMVSMTLRCAGCRWHSIEYDERRTESVCVHPEQPDCEPDLDGFMSHWEDGDLGLSVVEYEPEL